MVSMHGKYIARWGLRSAVATRTDGRIALGDHWPRVTSSPRRGYNFPRYVISCTRDILLLPRSAMSSPTTLLTVTSFPANLRDVILLAQWRDALWRHLLSSPRISHVADTSLPLIPPQRTRVKTRLYLLIICPTYL